MDSIPIQSGENTKKLCEEDSEVEKGTIGFTVIKWMSITVFAIWLLAVIITSN